MMLFKCQAGSTHDMLPTVTQYDNQCFNQTGYQKSPISSSIASFQYQQNSNLSKLIDSDDYTDSNDSKLISNSNEFTHVENLVANLSASVISTTSTLATTEEFLEAEHPSLPTYLKIWATLVITLLLIVGVAGNIIVAILVCRTRELRHSTNIFLLNLALADTLVLLVCLPTALVELHTLPDTWVLGATLCKYDIQVLYFNKSKKINKIQKSKVNNSNWFLIGKTS